jgi:hypothetical protein
VNEQRPALFDMTAEEVASDPTNANAMKLMDKARLQGWADNPFTSLVIRLTREDAEPFFISWNLGVTAKGKPSWRFAGARVRSGQPLTFNDALLYLEDPSVIYPEDPEGEYTNDDSDDCPA